MNSPTPTILRPATAADREPIEALLLAAHLPTEGVAAILRAKAADFVVAEQAGGVVGAGGLEMTPDGALLRSVVVRDDLRSAGVGRRIVERLVHEADCRGVALYLLTTTAGNWFPRFGFSRVDRKSVPSAIGETWEFKTGCAQTAIAMVRTSGGNGGNS